MKICENPQVIADHTAIFIPQISTLCLSDLHLGYEEELRRKGIFIPTGEFKRVEKLLESLLKRHQPKTVVLNGDLKHGFGNINSSEWRHTRKILERLKTKARVIIVEGNHDPVLAPVAKAEGLIVEPYHVEQGFLFVHGDAVPESKLLKDVHTIIMGHEHPAVAINNGVRSETYKCFLVMPYKKKTLVVLPSTFSLTLGTDVLAKSSKNPLLIELSKAHVYALEEENIVSLGQVSEIKKLLEKNNE